MGGERKRRENSLGPGNLLVCLAAQPGSARTALFLLFSSALVWGKLAVQGIALLFAKIILFKKKRWNPEHRWERTPFF